MSKTKTRTEFPERLRTLRAAASLSQQELADKIGHFREEIVYWEKGQRSPNWSTVCKLADALGVSMDAFRKDTGEVPAEPPDPWDEVIDRSQGKKSENSVDNP